MSEVPLVGRTTELRAVDEATGSAGVAGVVLAGPGGVGKTRLAVELLRRAEERGCPVRRVSATRSAAEVPLGSFASVLGEATSAPQALAALRSMLAASDDRRGMLLVDDAHALDPVSAGLVLQLADEDVVDLVVTVRTGEPCPDAITALWKDDRVVRLDLEPLADEELEALAAVFAGGELEPATARYLLRLANGNALALRELVIGAQVAGRLGERAGQLRLSGPVPITERLSELVATRLRSLDDAPRRALELVALGEPLPLDVLASATSAEILEDLEQQRLLEVRTEDGRPTAWMSHPLHGELLRDELLPLRRRALLSRLCDWLEEVPERTSTQDITLARWWQETGRDGDLAVVRRAAHACAFRGDLQATLAIAEPAWTATSDPELGFVLGHTLVEFGRWKEAVDVLEVARRLPADDWIVARIAGSLSAAFRRREQVDAARRVLRQASASLSGPLAAELDSLHATLLLGEARFEEGVGLLEPLLGTDADTAQVGGIMAYGLTCLGRGDEALALALRARAVAVELWKQAPMVVDLTTYDMSIAAGRISSGELAPTCESVEQAYVELSAHGTAPAVGALANQLTFCWHERGHLRTALRWARRALADYRALDDTPWMRIALARFVGVAAQAGLVDEAQAAADELPSTRLVSNEMFGGEDLVARVWLAWAAGDPVLATELLDEAFAWAGGNGGRTYAVLAAHTAQRLGLRPSTSVDAVVDELRRTVQGSFLHTKLDHVTAGLRRDSEALEAVAERFAAAGADLYAAEAFADASRARRREGEARTAIADARRSAELAELCEGVVTPALKLTGDVVPLSPREREVALLASTGLSTPDIAARLYLSSRTVQNHLNRAYEKLGVSSRKDLGSAL